MTCNLYTARNDIALFFLFILAFGTKETQKDTHRRTYSSRRYFCKHLDRRLFVLSLRSHNPRHARCVRAYIILLHVQHYLLTFFYFPVWGELFHFFGGLFLCFGRLRGVYLFFFGAMSALSSLAHSLFGNGIGAFGLGIGKLGTGKWETGKPGDG
jgi:hypothetical protein